MKYYKSFIKYQITLCTSKYLKINNNFITSILRKERKAFMELNKLRIFNFSWLKSTKKKEKNNEEKMVELSLKKTTSNEIIRLRK